jgi:predicted Zn-dependent protease
MRKMTVFCVAALFLTGCRTNPLTGQRTMALVDNNTLFASSFQQYEQFLNENTVITDTADARLVEQVGQDIKTATERWLASEGRSKYLADYRWEYHLVADDAVNAWCMPGGKIVVYTGLFR